MISIPSPFPISLGVPARNYSLAFVLYESHLKHSTLFDLSRPLSPRPDYLELLNTIADL